MYPAPILPPTDFVQTGLSCGNDECIPKSSLRDLNRVNSGTQVKISCDYGVTAEYLVSFALAFQRQ